MALLAVVYIATLSIATLSLLAGRSRGLWILLLSVLAEPATVQSIFGEAPGYEAASPSGTRTRYMRAVRQPCPSCAIPFAYCESADVWALTPDMLGLSAGASETLATLLGVLLFAGFCRWLYRVVCRVTAS